MHTHPSHHYHLPRYDGIELMTLALGVALITLMATVL